ATWHYVRSDIVIVLCLDLRLEDTYRHGSVVTIFRIDHITDAVIYAIVARRCTRRYCNLTCSRIKRRHSGVAAWRVYDRYSRIDFSDCHIACCRRITVEGVVVQHIAGRTTCHTVDRSHIVIHRIDLRHHHVDTGYSPVAVGCWVDILTDLVTDPVLARRRVRNYRDRTVSMQHRYVRVYCIRYGSSRFQHRDGHIGRIDLYTVQLVVVQYIAYCGACDTVDVVIEIVVRIDDGFGHQDRGYSLITICRIANLADLVRYLVRTFCRTRIDCDRTVRVHRDRTGGRRCSHRAHMQFYFDRLTCRISCNACTVQQVIVQHATERGAALMAVDRSKMVVVGLDDGSFRIVGIVT